MSRLAEAAGGLAALLGIACAGVQGGTSPAPPRSCAELARMHAAALEAADGGSQGCDAGTAEACTALRARLDDPCHCLVRIPAAAVPALDALAAEWSARGCVTDGLCNRACLSP